jgi:hypothetical protein
VYVGKQEAIQKRGSGKLGFAVVGFTWTYNSVLVDVELIRNHFSANATAGAITFDFLIRPEAMKRIVSISQP